MGVKESDLPPNSAADALRAGVRPYLSVACVTKEGGEPVWHAWDGFAWMVGEPSGSVDKLLERWVVCNGVPLGVVSLGSSLDVGEFAVMLSEALVAVRKLYPSRFAAGERTMPPCPTK